MSFGTSPSTMTVDPTPPGLRPLQNQLVQMLMSRIMGQGRSSVPTYGSGIPNIQQQLYGTNPRTPPAQTRGSGPPPTGSPGSYPPSTGLPSSPPPGSPGSPGSPRTYPPPIGAGVPSPHPTPVYPRQPVLYGGGIGDPITPSPTVNNPLTGPVSGPINNSGPTIMPFPGVSNLPMPNDTLPWATTYPELPTLGAMTRGGPMGIMQGASNPWEVPSYGNVMNGSGLIRSMQNPYGSY